MATSLQVRPHNRDLGMVMREVDEDLAIFLGIKSGEKERNELVQIHTFDASTSAEPEANGLGEEAYHIVGNDSLLDLETGKNDHDWLFAQQDLEQQTVSANHTEILTAEFIPLSPEKTNASVELVPTTGSKSNSLDSSSSNSTATKRPASSGTRKPASRAATPTRRSAALPAKTKPSRASTPSKTSTTSSKPQGRSSTPSRATATSSSSKPASRSSTPSRATATSSSLKPASRSSTPSRSSTSKPATRSATPTRKPASKNPVPTRGVSQTVNSRPSNPLEMLSVSHDAPQALKKSLARRPASASRGRPSGPSSIAKLKPRQQSCSPTKVTAQTSTTHRNGSAVLSRSRGYSHGGGDDVNPVLMGTKMVERVVNMRKLAPPKQDERVSLDNNKKSSHENPGFGRSLSNRSLDMAIRHMDIRRSVSGNLKPVATSVMSYFSNGNQSSSSQSSSFGISESPITSRSDSSKSSSFGNSYFLDGRQMDD